MKLKKLFLIGSILVTPAFAGDSDFKSLCEISLQSADKKLCTDVSDVFFKNKKSDPLVYINPSVLNVAEMSIDKKVDYIVFNDPNYLSGVAYCYFVYKNWISFSTISPDVLGTSATGFSILNEDLKEYQNWLKTSVNAKSCIDKVEKEAQVKVSDLTTYLKDKIAIIGINPYAVIQTPGITLNATLEELQTTINHERIHALQAACPAFEKWSMEQWRKLPVKEKNQYIKKYSSYSWSIPKVAAREFVGYFYEKKVDELMPIIKDCVIK